MLRFLTISLMAAVFALPAQAAPVDPNPMKMERIQLENDRTMILQGGRAYAVNWVGVKRKLHQPAKYRAKDGSIITVKNGFADIERPAQRARSPQPATVESLEEAARKVGVAYPPAAARNGAARR